MSNAATLDFAASTADESSAPSARASRIRLVTGVAACAFLVGLVISVRYFRGVEGSSPMIAANSAPIKIRPAPDYVANDDIDVARVSDDNEATIVAPLTTRMVKSIAIRPDGSIAAASEVASLEAQARIGFLETGTPVRAEIAAAAAVTPEPVGEPAPTRTPVAVAAVTPAPIVDAPAPIAEPLPAESTVIARTPSTQPARTAAGTGAYFVQLAASPSEDEARNLMQKLQIKLGDNLGRRDLLIQEGAVKDKAVYRVRVGALSREDANTLCNRLKSLNACFVAKD